MALFGYSLDAENPTLEKREKWGTLLLISIRFDFLLYGYGLSQVSGLIYVAATADGDVIGEQL